MHHFIPGRKVLYATVDAKRCGDLLGQFKHGVRRVRANVEYLVTGLLNQGRTRNKGRDIVDVRKRSGLHSIAEDCHGTALQSLVHEDPDYIPVAIRNVLPLTVDIVWTKDRVVESEHLVGRPEIEFDGVF